jgi:hypothetical protein
MAQSFFMDKSSIPTTDELSTALGATFSVWNELASYAISLNPTIYTEWKYPGDKYGWSFRVRDKKRVIVYLIPHENYFSVALVFGQKATNHALGINISENIKNLIINAPVYAEGRGFQLEVFDGEILTDITKLIDVKINH